ncbi:MAG: hypothetical protein WC668_00580 [Patescibacteria group bacterium]|jgi:hypothetical protein
MLIFVLTTLLFFVGIAFLFFSAGQFDPDEMTEENFKKLIITIALAAAFFLASLTLHVIMT